MPIASSSDPLSQHEKNQKNNLEMYLIIMRIRDFHYIESDYIPLELKGKILVQLKWKNQMQIFRKGSKDGGHS